MMHYIRTIIISLLIGCVLCACVGGGKFDADGYRIIEFNDNAFKMALLDKGLDTNGDREISMLEIQVPTIDCTDRGIMDASELRLAREAQRLLFSGNKLSKTLDLSKLKKLTEIDFTDNPSLAKIILHYEHEDNESFILNVDPTTVVQYTKRPVDDEEEEKEKEGEQS